MVASFVPDDFVVPLEFTGRRFRLERLGPEHNEADHQAWTSSVEHIHETPGFARSRWPFPMSVDENLRAIKRHADDFDHRQGFTYAVIEPGGNVIGSVYIYPSDDPDCDAAVRSWVTSDQCHLDHPLWESVTNWLRSTWPFAAVDYARRKNRRARDANYNTATIRDGS